MALVSLTGVLRGDVKRRYGLPTECNVFADSEEFANGSGELGGLMVPRIVDCERAIVEAADHQSVAGADMLAMDTWVRREGLGPQRCTW